MNVGVLMKGIEVLVGGGGVLEHVVAVEQVSVCLLQLLELMPLQPYTSSILNWLFNSLNKFIFQVKLSKRI